MRTRDYILIELNGKLLKIDGAHAGLMLSDLLRYEQCLTGTKVVCAEGDCGACTVLRALPNGQYEPLNSCIAPVGLLDCSSLVSVEALANRPEGSLKTTLSPAQNAMMNCHASQCGFCTPGFVMALTGLVEKKLAKKNSSPISTKEAKNALTGNLCRCTGYQPILDAACSISLSGLQPLSKSYLKNKPALKKASKTSLEIKTADLHFFAPVTLKEAATFLAKHKTARLLGSATDLGVQINKGKTKLQTVVSLHLIPDLTETLVIKPASAKKKPRFRVGARVSLTKLRKKVQPLVPEFAKFLDLFASPQIKNVATLAGNIANASPIADTPPFLLVANTVLHTLSSKGKRTIPLEEFYLGYKKIALKPGEFITSVEFDIPQKTEKLSLSKVSQRKDLDISTVNSAFRARYSQDGLIEDISIALGGVSAIPLRLTKTELFLKGKFPQSETLKKALLLLHDEITPLSDLRGTQAFRRIVTENLFLKFFGEPTP